MGFELRSIALLSFSAVETCFQIGSKQRMIFVGIGLLWCGFFVKLCCKTPHEKTKQPSQERLPEEVLGFTIASLITFIAWLLWEVLPWTWIHVTSIVVAAAVWMWFVCRLIYVCKIQRQPHQHAASFLGGGNVHPFVQLTGSC